MEYIERPFIMVIMIIVICMFFIGLMVGYSVAETATEERALKNYTQLKRDAVENNAAYWCVVEHEKVFSWNECGEVRE